MAYDVVVVGAGVGGLFSALSLAKRGKKVLVVERQPKAGGVATSFRRRGFTFESSLHCVDGLGREGEIRQFLCGCGLDKALEFIELDKFSRIIYPGFEFVNDFNALNFEDCLISRFPSEKNNIKSFFRAVGNSYRQLDGFFNSPLPPWVKFSLGRLFWPEVFSKLTGTVERYICRHIKEAKVKAALSDLWHFAGLAPAQLSAAFFLLVFRGYQYGSTAYIRGGFSVLFDAIVKFLRENGCEVRFNCLAKKITVDSKRRVKAVLTDDGSRIEAKAVISNASCFDTLLDLIDDSDIQGYYKKLLPTMQKSISAFQVYLGTALPLKELGMESALYSVSTSYDQRENFEYCLKGDYQRSPISLASHTEIDPGLAPEGKGTLVIMCLDAYSNWLGLNAQEYHLKKMETARILIRRAESYLPGLSRHIEVMECATPLTIERFAKVAEGSIYGLAQTPEQALFRRLEQQTKVKGLFLAGAWTRPGAGFHGCFISALDAVDLTERYLSSLPA